MKHGIAFRKLSRTSSHRNLMLRNLVSSLFEHEQIRTTLPKAKETARLAEKIITLGKNGDLQSRQKAEAFLLNPNETLPKLFTTFQARYASRPGGYTRIHKFGHRQGDHAPHAVLELIDGPRDLKFEMAARAVGRETLSGYLHGHGSGSGKKKEQVVGTLQTVGSAGEGQKVLRERTKWAVEKTLKYRGDEGKALFQSKAQDYVHSILAEPRAHAGLFVPTPIPVADRGGSTRATEPRAPSGLKRSWQAGERLAGMSVTASGMGLAKGALGPRPQAQSKFWQGAWKEKVGLPSKSAAGVSKR